MIYFDNSATTRCSDEVVALMNEALTENFGNPSSLHGFGLKGRNYVKEAREAISKTLKCQPKEIYFTSGGSEGNNLAIKGVCEAKKRLGNHIITTKIEHPCVLNTVKYLEKNGFEATYLGTDEYGVIDIEELKAAIRPETILVSIMMVNNEIGSVMPIKEIGAAIKAINPNIIFHTDAVQAYGKYKIVPKNLNVDILTVSGHKIHGPKGSGFIYIKDGVRVVPQIHGGGQENGLRSGTENVPAIAGLGLASSLAYEDFEAKQESLYKLREEFISKISNIDGVTINGHLDRNSAPHIVSVSIAGNRTKAQVMLNALEQKGIYVSAGSACSSNKPGISETLKSIGVDRSLLEKTIRFSFSTSNTLEEVDEAAAVLKELVPMMTL